MQDLFIEFLPPWVETGLQPAFYDRESGTVLQQTARMYAKVNELVKAVNGMDKIIKEYVDYINHYFENLDVQEEINNKLDAMAEGGELAEYIAQYANLPCVHAYDTIADMASSTSLVDGSFARAMSKTVAGTGDGAYYKIRETVEGDDPDGENLVAITGTTLVAEIIPDYAVSELESDLEAISETVEEITPLAKKYLFVGDSYATGYQGEGQATLTGFFTRVKNTLDLDATIVAQNGYGFLGMGGVNKWQTLIENASIANKDLYTDIIIAGGMNDPVANLGSQIDTTIAYLKTNFPNATIHIAMIGKYKTASDADLSRIRDVYKLYKDGASRNNCKFVENAGYILHDVSWFIGDGIHPTEAGQQNLAKYFMEYIANGSISIFYQNDLATLTNGTNVSLTNFSVYTSLENNIVRVMVKGAIAFSTPIATLSNLDEITLGTFTKSFLCASDYNQGLHITCQAYAWSQSDSKPHLITLSFENDASNHLIARVFLVDKSDTYSLTSVSEIAIVSDWQSSVVPSIYC